MTPHTPPTPGKVLSHEQLLRLRAEAKAVGRAVVQCHGCFDIVHPGHIRHLRHARALGDVLLVSITGDAEMRKGTGRPLIPEELRAENLAALDCVDWVYIEARSTAADLLAEVRPNVYVKGREYEFNLDPRFKAERETVERHGGRVVFSSGDVVFSSSALIAAMEQAVDPFHQRLEQLAGHAELDQQHLAELLTRFRGLRVLVVGETILDTYLFCDRPEMAGESPVMTLRPVEKRHYDGGAAVIARHIAALGGRPVLVTALPDGPEGESLRRRLMADGVEVRAITVDSAIAEKQRFLVGAQKVMKLDLVEPLVLDASQQDELADLAATAATGGAGTGCRAAILADFGLGLLTPAVTVRLCTSLRPEVSILSGDVSGRRSSLLSMRGMDLLCPSESELRDATRLHGEGLPAATWDLLERTQTRSAIVTLGAEGLIAFDRLHGATGPEWTSRLRGEHVPALCPLAVDQLGCGDALLSAATMALAAGGSLIAAGFVGAAAAAVEVQRLGNIPVSASDLRQLVARVQGAHLTYAAPEVLEARPYRFVPTARAS